MSQSEKELIDKCIESHYNMIKYHRKAIQELERKKFKEREWCEECFDIEVINEGR
tara:strand:- start:865 stop:1029 length:165 start_codon:yes stop_codon:yes gene_type:complete